MHDSEVRHVYSEPMNSVRRTAGASARGRALPDPRSWSTGSEAGTGRSVRWGRRRGRSRPAVPP